MKIPVDNIMYSMVCTAPKEKTKLRPNLIVRCFHIDKKRKLSIVAIDTIDLSYVESDVNFCPFCGFSYPDTPHEESTINL